MRNWLEHLHVRPAYLLGILLLGLSVCGAALIKQDVISENVWVLGVPLAGLPEKEAKELVLEKARQIEGGSLTFEAGNVRYEVDSRRLGLKFDDSAIEQSVRSCVASRPKVMPVFFFKQGAHKVIAASCSFLGPSKDPVFDEIAGALSKEPLPGRYGFEGRELILLSPEDGQTVTPADVKRALENVGEEVVRVPFTAILGSSEEPEPLVLLGEFSTEYDVAKTDRNANLALACSAVHGKVLLPGQTFSFNEATGERSFAKGYRYAEVVVGDRLVPGLAGGTCQITTTLFNAAFRAGLQFPEARAHGIPVDYVPPGADAAVAGNYMDLKIRNGTAGPVVLGAWVEDGEVAVRVFGKKSDLTYDMEIEILEEYPAQGKMPGLLVETFRVTKRGDEVVERTRIMRSRYQAKALNGTE